MHVYHDERVQGLDPRLVQAIEEYERSGPLPITITEGYRTPERQAELKRQGKTNADPSQAPHCRKAAFDFAVVREVKNGAVRQVWLGEQAPEKYALVGQWFEERGLIWGGRWAFGGVFGELGDAPHIEVPNWRALPLA